MSVEIDSQDGWEVALVYKTACAASEADCIEGALRACLESICELTGWAFGRSWIWSAQDGDGGRPASIWYPVVPDWCAGETCGAELAGLVRASRGQVWIPDLASDSRLQALEGAAAAGICSAVGLPIPVTAGIVVVFGFFDFDPIVPPEGRRRELFDDLARHIGSAIGRQHVAVRLRESEDRFRRLADDAPVQLWMSDETAKCTWFNRPWLDFTGRTMEQEIGDGWAEGVHPEDLDRCLETYLEAFAARRPFSMEYRLRRADGVYRVVLANGAPRRGPDDSFLGYAGTCVDITEIRDAQEQQRRLEERARQAQRFESLGMLAGGIAHDFNNILTTILGNAELATHALPPDAPAREAIGSIRAAASQAAGLCKQMLAYAGRGSFEVRRVELGELVRGMEGLLRSSVSKTTSLEFSLEPDLPCVEADPSQFAQVVMNLVTNASQSLGDAPGVVRVATRVVETDGEPDPSDVARLLPAGRYVCCEVSDTGCGMDALTLSRIFEPFFSTKVAGRGLGLASALGIMHGHRGTIRVHSRVRRGPSGSSGAPHGTHFQALFPCAVGDAEHGADVASDDGLPDWQGSGTVLLVDDEASVRAVGEKFLRTLGFDVLLASDGLAALEVFARHRDAIRLVLLDLSMPVLGGEDTLKALSTSYGADLVPVLLMTGYSDMDEATLHDGYPGRVSILRKPYGRADLVRQLRALLDAGA